MDDQKDKKQNQENINSEAKPETTDFMKETIKQRPLNRKKLLRRTIITASMAVIFGLIACVTFLLLEPVISNRLYPEEEPQTVVFVEETREDEILPEDMLTEDRLADEAESSPEPTAPAALEDSQIEQVLSEMELGVEDYLSLSGAVRDVAKTAENSMVKVVGITSDRDWFDNEYQNEDIVSGVVVADNGREILILANLKNIKGAELLEIVFVNGDTYVAEIKQEDRNTGLGILSIVKAKMAPATIDVAKPVSMGTSSNVNLPGNPVIAIGSPMGVENSISIGVVTSSGNAVHLPDATYKWIGTDIYGSTSASGILINLRGQLIGIIDMTYNDGDMKNLISGIGISELKKLVECLSNDKAIAYLGVYGMDVPVDAHEQMQVPLGAYIYETVVDSPAMEAGVQSGDVITKIGQTEITSYQELVNALYQLRPDAQVTVTLMRQGTDGYTEIEVNVTLK